MLFDLDLIKKVYQAFPEKVTKPALCWDAQ
jgi:hypothetical protein